MTGVPGIGQALVSWSTPVSDGGEAITGYTVTSNPGARTCTTALTTCTVGGLTNGTSYTFMVVATNGVGDSLPSVPSPPTVPKAPAPSFAALSPGRVLESRVGDRTTVDGQFWQVGSRAAGSVTELTVAGRAGVPGDAPAVVLNVTVTEPQNSGYVTVYPCGTEPPNASNLNFSQGQTIANAVVARVGANGKVCLFTSATTHLVADVNGYFPRQLIN